MTLKFINSKPLQSILANRGDYTIKKGPKYRELIQFDEKWGHLFENFYQKPFLRLVFHYFIHDSFKSSSQQVFDLNTMVNDFGLHQKKIEKCIQDIQLIIHLCPHCESESFNKKERHGKSYYYCKSCKQEFNDPLLKHSLSQLEMFDIYYFLNELIKAKILARGYQLRCYHCGKTEMHPNKNDAQNNIVCRKCNNLKELIHIFTLVDTLKQEKNLDSLWFEWYIFRLISEKSENTLSIVPNHVVIGDKFKTEVDLLMITKNETLISIDCKAKIFTSTLSKNDINNNILNWAKFSDLVLIATTAEISGDCRDFWSDQLDNIKFVDGKDLEKLNEILASF